MTWRPELVALDIDGTLVDRQGNLPLDVKAAVQRVVASATPLVLATGRAWLDARPVFEQLELPPGPVVCSNGAVVLGHPPLKEPRMVTFNPGEVIDTVVEHAPNARIAVEELGVGFRLNRLFPEGDLRGRLTIQSLAELAARPVPRVIVCDPDARQEDFVELAASIGMHGVSYSVGWSAWLDIAPAGSTRPLRWPASAANSASPQTTCWPWAMVTTTSKCWPGPVAESRWVTPLGRSGPQPPTSQPTSTTAAPPSN